MNQKDYLSINNIERTRFDAQQKQVDLDIKGIRWRKYESMKQAWIAANRHATPEQHQRAMAQIARRCGL